MSGSFDLHAHFAPQGFWEQIERLGGDRIGVRRGPDLGFEFLLDGTWRNDMCLPALQDWEQRLAMMDQQGIRAQVISVTANPHVTWADPAVGLELSRQINDELGWATTMWPGRIYGWAAIPLQDVRLAIPELRRAKEIGLVGVQIPSHVGPIELDDAVLDPFWEAAEDLDFPVFVHNQALGGDPRIPGRLRHVIGAPLETTIAVTRLIFASIPDRYPKVRFLLTHGGGTLPYIVGRLDRAWEVMGRPLPNPPSVTLRGFWYDTVLQEPSIMEHLLRFAGPLRVVVGTDYPYPLGQELSDGLPVGLVVPTELRGAILQTNAEALLGRGLSP